MRVLLQSNAPWVSTGYGRLAKYLLPRWKAMGHEVACFAFNGLNGGILNLDGITMFPLGKEMWGRDKAEYYYHRWGADVFVTFLDVWAIPELSKMNLRWMPYCPVDHVPCPKPISENLKGAYRVIAMATSGQKLLKDAGIESTPIYHGVDRAVYKPLGDKAKYKNQLGFDKNDFVIGVVAMNKGRRKNFPDVFEAFKKFHDVHDNARLYLHSDPRRQDGMDLLEMAKTMGISHLTAISDPQVHDIGNSDEEMAEMYNGFDVTLSIGAGEGFGFPIIESQSCGVPVITNDFTTGRELNAFESLVSPVGRLYMDELSSYQCLSNIDEVVKRLEIVYGNESDMYEKGCHNFTEQFDWDVIAHKWGEVFAEVEADISKEKSKETKKKE